MDRVGTTQLYDKTVVYNHKRHGSFSLGGRKFDFRVKPSTWPSNPAGVLAEQRDQGLLRAFVNHYAL